MDFYSKHEHCPNDTHGGGGCLASGGLPNEDCAGPWYNFWRVQTEDVQSPYAVICQYHLDRLNATADDEDLQTEGDPLPLRQRKILTREDTGLPSMPASVKPGLVGA